MHFYMLFHPWDGIFYAYFAVPALLGLFLHAFLAVPARPGAPPKTSSMHIYSSGAAGLFFFRYKNLVKMHREVTQITKNSVLMQRGAPGVASSMHFYLLRGPWKNAK